MIKSIIYVVILFNYFGCKSQNIDNHYISSNVIAGAEQIQEFLPLLKGKKVAAVVNQTSQVNGIHLIDTLMKLNIAIIKIFTPEHGFRGEADAGEKVDNSTDQKTGIPIVSLYGNHKKPTNEDFEGIDIVIFDIQDVGVRFYTYVSTMSYVMETCAEYNKPFLILDRPNPNGFYVDGPVLQPEFKSFVGIHPGVPVVHGMTLAEYALMINEEGWLQNGLKSVYGTGRCDLRYVLCKNYNHNKLYTVLIKPSPNLPNNTAIYLYPSLCLFEGTVVSVGRGTDHPFQIFGHPEFPDTLAYSFTPRSTPGAKYPIFENEKCYGYNLSGLNDSTFVVNKRINLEWLIKAYQQYPDKEHFFNDFFYKLAGNAELKQQIMDGMDEAYIRATWKKDLEKFLEIRKKYLLYKDF